MNKLNIATTGYPGTTKSWRFVKESYEMIADALAKLVDQDNPVIITGVKVNGTDVTEGYIAWKGELFYFQASPKTDYVVIIEDREAVEYNTNPTNAGQLEIHDTYITRYAKCGDQGEGVDEFPFSSLKRISSVLDIDQRTGPASVTSLGVVEIATQQEVNAGSDDTRVVTPATLAGLTATTGRKGIIQIATQPEVAAGADYSKAVTPGTLAGMSFGRVLDKRSEVVSVAYMDNTNNLLLPVTSGVIEINGLSLPYNYIVLASFNNPTAPNLNDSGTLKDVSYHLLNKQTDGYKLKWNIEFDQSPSSEHATMVIDIIVMSLA